MRSMLATLAIGAALLAAAPAQAEKRIFIIANQPDGYGIDQCLADGANCGAAAAAAYCQSRDFTRAASYRRIERDEVTGAVPVGGACGRNGCDAFVAIECTK